MKIDGQKPRVGTEQGVERNRGANGPRKAASGATKTAKPDQQQGPVNVKLSEKAQEFKKVRGMVDTVPELRETMIVKLKTDIEQGNYRVNAEKVAEKMIERAIIDSLRKDSR